MAPCVSAAEMATQGVLCYLLSYVTEQGFYFEIDNFPVLCSEAGMESVLEECMVTEGARWGSQQRPRPREDPGLYLRPLSALSQSLVLSWSVQDTQKEERVGSPRA